jgi:hypothetical protein
MYRKPSHSAARIATREQHDAQLEKLNEALRATLAEKSGTDYGFPITDCGLRITDYGFADLRY